jgi:hypothetical protein
MLYLQVLRSLHFLPPFLLSNTLQSLFFTIQVLASKNICQNSTQASSTSVIGQKFIVIAPVEQRNLSLLATLSRSFTTHLGRSSLSL